MAQIVKTPDYKITYNGRDVTRDLDPYFMGAEFTDKFDGEADELDVSLLDPDGRWLKEWYPSKGDQIRLQYGYVGEKLADTGDLDVDEVEMSGPPNQVRIKALAVGLTSQSRTRIGKTYEKTNLKAIVATVAKKLKAKVYGNIASIPIKKATQYQETNWAFLVRICREHGYRVKLTDSSKRLVVEKIEDLNKTIALTITPSSVKSWTYRDKITEVPKKSSVRYHDPAKKSLTKGEVAAGKVATGVTSAHESKKHVQAGSPAQAKAIAQADQSRQEIDKTSLEFEMEGDQSIGAGSAIKVDKFGKINGEYVASEVRHSISSSEYAMSLQTKRVKE